MRRHNTGAGCGGCVDTERVKQRRSHQGPRRYGDAGMAEPMEMVSALCVPPALALRLASSANEAALLLRVSSHARDMQRRLTAYAQLVGATEQLSAAWAALWAGGDRALLAAAPCVANQLRRCGGRGKLLEGAGRSLEALHGCSPLLRCYADAHGCSADEMRRAMDPAACAPLVRTKRLAARLEVGSETLACLTHTARG